MRLDVSLLAVLLILALAWLYRRDQAAARRLRGAIFDDCRGLLAGSVIAPDAAGYPVLTGRYRGYGVRLEALLDAVAVRKLPSLWVKITLSAEVPFPGVFDLMMRPLNTEFYSPAGSLEHTLATPEGWPDHATLRTDDPAGVPPLALLARHVELFRDPRAKELLIAPRGLRVVYQLDQAERSYYLVLRQARFGVNRADPERIAALLEALIVLYADLTAAQPTRRPRPRLSRSLGAGVAAAEP